MRNIKKAVDLIKEFEGYYDKAYKCPAGVWTIGYGTIQYPDGKKVKAGDVCDKKLAEAWLMHEVNEKAERVEKLISSEINNNQFCALVSFAYNVGTGALGRSTMLRYINRGQLKLAALEFKKWNKAGGRVLKGLTRRRLAEQELFNKESVAEDAT